MQLPVIVKRSPELQKWIGLFLVPATSGSAGVSNTGSIQSVVSGRSSTSFC